MASSKHSKKESAKATGSDTQNLQNLNDLYSLELSQAFAQAIEAGLIRPTYADAGISRFQIEFCPQHQMVLLPTCAACG